LNSCFPVFFNRINSVQILEKYFGQKLTDSKTNLNFNLIFKAMKRIILGVVLITAFCTASFSGKPVAKGETHTSLGKYKIALADNQLPLKGVDCKSYVVTYENSPMEVTIAICKESECRKYVVLSDKLSVQYVCTNDYFGVEKLDKEFEKEGYRTSNNVLNRSEYFHQKGGWVSSHGPKTSLSHESPWSTENTI